MSKYPEHDKLKKYKRDAATLSGFIDFISEQGWELAEWSDKTERLLSIRQRPDEIIGLFLGIDPKKLEAEKQAMLTEIRQSNEAKGAN